jgi:hypothetical protein
MASTISAGTSAGTAIAIAGDTSGNLVFQTQAGTYTQTVPNATGTVMVTGNMPAFSAYNSNAQSVANATYTKIQFNTKEFDTNSNYDNATNYRFTPTVAGYYQVNLSVGNGSGNTTGYTLALIYKNGSAFKTNLGQPSVNGPSTSVSAIIQMNGSTDYLEGYWFQNSGGALNASSGQQYTVFSAAMIRGA